MKYTFAIALTLFALTHPVGAQGLAAGTSAPEIDLPSLDGARVQLSALHGHPVVVSFWATWCPPCKEEFPELVRIFRAHSATGLLVLAVNGRDQESSTRAVRKFAEHYAAIFPIALDETGMMRSTYQITGLPTTLFVDNAGVIRLVNVGPISATELDRGVALILPKR